MSSSNNNQVKSVLGQSLAWRVFSLSLAYGSLVLAMLELYRMSCKYWQVYTDAGKPWQAYINVRENEGWIGNRPIVYNNIFLYLQDAGSK